MTSCSLCSSASHSGAEWDQSLILHGAGRRGLTGCEKRELFCIQHRGLLLAMGAISDAMGGPIYGFMLATGFAALLFFGLVLNGVFSPADEVFQRAVQSDYKV